MFNSVLPVLLCLLGVSAGIAYGTTHKRTSKHPATPVATASTRKTAKTHVASKASAGKTTPVASRGKTGAKSSAKSRASRQKTPVVAHASRQKTPAVAHRSVQTVPTPDRYREIQQALADKGYYQGTVSGSWGSDSADALRRFQKDQSLTESGKLDSLSLIALGLGPKRNLSARSTTETRPKDDNRRPEGSERP